MASMKMLCAALIASVLASPVLAQSPAPTSAPDNPLNMKVHHITASATDVDRAVKWYQDVLGFRLDQRASRNNGALQFAELSIPGFGLALVQQGPRPAADAAAAPAGGAPAATGNRWIHIVFGVADPGKTLELIKARGGMPRVRAAAGAPVTTFLINDSEGNEIEFVALDSTPVLR